MVKEKILVQIASLEKEITKLRKIAETSFDIEEAVLGMQFYHKGRGEDIIFLKRNNSQWNKTSIFYACPTQSLIKVAEMGLCERKPVSPVFYSLVI